MQEAFDSSSCSLWGLLGMRLSDLREAGRGSLLRSFSSALIVVLGCPLLARLPPGKAAYSHGPKTSTN